MDQAFPLIFAFDEIVALGYRESVNLAQIRTFTEMESHEEAVFKSVREVNILIVFLIILLSLRYVCKISYIYICVICVLDTRKRGQDTYAEEGQGITGCTQRKPESRAKCRIWGRIWEWFVYTA